MAADDSTISILSGNAVAASFQPFQCLICHSRFTRHENLKRHATLHTRPQNEASFTCDYCNTSFSRSDLRYRHMKRKHPEYEDRQPRKRLQRNSPARLPREGQSQRDRLPSSSSGDSPNSLQLQQSDEQAGLEMSNDGWNTSLRYDQPRLDYGYKGHSENTNPVASATRSTSRLTQQPVMNESRYVDDIEPDPTYIEQSLLIGESFRRSGHHFGGISTPQPTLFESDLTSVNFDQSIAGSLPSTDLPYLKEDWSPSTTQMARGIELYFTHVSNFVPFLHQTTFAVTQVADHLILSMLSLAYQYGEDPDCGDQVGSGTNLSIRCFHRARVLIGSQEEKIDDLTCNVTTVQAYLLLQICAMMYLCGKDSTPGLEMHSKMISLARTGGLMQPMPVESDTIQDLESLWQQFIKAESHKRTLFALHQIDALWYQFLSIPRSLSHLEIKHDLPCPEEYWKSSTAAEWAHRQLVSRNSAPTVKYADAVRLFLSSSSDLNTLPVFDPYGAINITQFLISSAREVSGWSTMTGMLSMERFGPLKSSLIALSPFIHSQSGKLNSMQNHLCEATWETAMIELQMWSLSHTSGIVQGSIDAVLNHSTYLASSCEYLCDSDTAKEIQPHLNWFLHYLDTTEPPDFEAPWVVIYAYKAFLIAWQLVRGGLVGVMQVVGVQDGDTDGALSWAKKVFQRRKQRQLGKLIMSCLDDLGK